MVLCALCASGVKKDSPEKGLPVAQASRLCGHDHRRDACATGDVSMVSILGGAPAGAWNTVVKVVGHLQKESTLARSHVV